MVELIVINNPFTMERELTEKEYTGQPLSTYIDLD